MHGSLRDVDAEFNGFFYELLINVGCGSILRRSSCSSEIPTLYLVSSGNYTENNKLGLVNDEGKMNTKKNVVGSSRQYINVMGCGCQELECQVSGSKTVIKEVINLGINR